MFVVPFIGLSVLIHIAIIVFFNVFHITPINWLRISRYKKISSFVGSVIILTVFTLAIFSASLLVRVSLQEKHSNLAFFENHQKVLVRTMNFVYMQTIKVNPAIAE